MPVVLTKEYLDHTFFIPMKADKSEGVWVKPLNETMRRRNRDAALQEAGQDQALASEYVVRNTLKDCVTNWAGFFDAAGKEIPFSVDTMLELIKIDPELFSGLYLRVISVARFGAIEEIKN
jgi:hypothetical protein